MLLKTLLRQLRVWQSRNSMNERLNLALGGAHLVFQSIKYKAITLDAIALSK